MEEKKIIKKGPQGNNSIVQEPRPGLTAGEEKGQFFLTSEVGGRDAWRAGRSEGERGASRSKTDDFRVRKHRKII